MSFYEAVYINMLALVVGLFMVLREDTPPDLFALLVVLCIDLSGLVAPRAALVGMLVLWSAAYALVTVQKLT